MAEFNSTLCKDLRMYALHVEHSVHSAVVHVPNIKVRKSCVGCSGSSEYCEGGRLNSLSC